MLGVYSQGIWLVLVYRLNELNYLKLFKTSRMISEGGKYHHPKEKCKYHFKFELDYLYE